MSNIKVIYPYIKRIKRTKENLSALVYEHKTQIQRELKESELFDEILNHDNAPKSLKFDLIVFNYQKTKYFPDDIWEKLSYNGWLCISDSKFNFELAKKWRIENKITSLLTRIDDWIFFQKENYDSRSSDRGNQLLRKVSSDIESDEYTRPLVPVPDWNDSHLKEEYLMKYGNGKMFVETGTYLGQTVELARRSSILFESIKSIEIESDMCRNARLNFEFDPRIEIIEGDSVDKIKQICDDLKNQTATFWLDAHASGQLPGGPNGPNPLMEELESIKSTGRNDHTIFIDDRRLFGSGEWGGLQESDVMDKLKEINPYYNIVYLDGHQENDVICATVVNNEFIEKETNNEKIPEEIANYFNVSKKKTAKPKEEILFL